MNVDSLVQNSYRFRRKLAELGPHLFCFAILIGGLVNAQSSIGGESYGYPVSREKVVIDKNKFDFKGTLEWDFVYENGQMAPHLTGEIDLKDAGGQCGRMRMDYYGGAHLFLTTRYGGEVCAKGDSRQSWTVDLTPYESNKVNEVKVSIEKKTASKDWSILESRTVKFEPVHDKVKITEDGFDFGGETFVAGAPTNSAEVTWVWKEGKVTPQVSGRLHINNAASACARLHLEYFTAEGLVADKYGEKFCASDNSHYYNDVDLSKYSDGKLTSITINLQTLRADGTWKTIGATSSTFAVPKCDEPPCGTFRLSGGSIGGLFDAQ